MAKLLLHIGEPKAGSTALQEMLRANRDALAGQGVLAWEPDRALGPPARMLFNRFAPPGKRLLPRERLHFATRAEATAASLACWETLAAEVRATRPALTVLSSEAFFALRDVATVGAALDEIFDDITVLAYLRDPAAHYASALDEQIRDGTRLAALSVPSAFHFPPAETPRGWQDRLGPSRVILRNIARGGLEGGDLITDFLGHMGRLAGHAVAAPVPSARANESLCAAATLLLLAVNETFDRFSGGGDGGQIRARLALIRRLRAAPELAGLPKLRLGDDALAAWARLARAGASGWYNAHLGSDQPPLPLPPAGTELPSAQAQHARLRAWLEAEMAAADLGAALRAALAPAEG